MYGRVDDSKVKLDEFEVLDLVTALQHVVVVLPLRRTVPESELKPSVGRFHLQQTLSVAANCINIQLPCTSSHYTASSKK